MHHPAVAHTLAIYARIYNHLPPLVPFEIQKKFKTELDRLSSTDTVSLEEVETLMAPFAHEVWHYLKAFDEILALHEQTLGEIHEIIVDFCVDEYIVDLSDDEDGDLYEEFSNEVWDYLESIK